MALSAQQDFNNILSQSNVDIQLYAPRCGKGYPGPKGGFQIGHPTLAELANYGVSGNFLDYMAASDPSDPAFWQGQNNTLRWAMFPVVRYFLRSGAVATVQPQSASHVAAVAVIPYVVIVSRDKYSHPTFTENGVPLLPNHVAMATGTATQVHIDNNFVIGSDMNSLLAITASILLSDDRWPLDARQQQRNVYVTIAPYLTAEDTAHYVQYHQQWEMTGGVSAQNVSKPRQCFAFGGASLGVATFAAMCSMPAMAYTGVLSNWGHDAVLDRSPAGVNIARRSIMGANLLEDVREVDLKALWAFRTQTGLIVPLNTQWPKIPLEQLVIQAHNMSMSFYNKDTGRREPSKLSRAPNQQNFVDATSPVINALMSNAYYSTQRRSDGMTFAEYGSFVLPCVNMSDAWILAATYAGHVYGSGRGVDYISEARQRQIATIQNTAEVAIKKRVVRKAASAAASKKGAKAPRPKGSAKPKKVPTGKSSRPRPKPSVAAAALVPNIPRLQRSRVSLAEYEPLPDYEADDYVRQGGGAPPAFSGQPSQQLRGGEDDEGGAAGLLRLPGYYKQRLAQETFGDKDLANFRKTGAVPGYKSRAMATFAQYRAQRPQDLGANQREVSPPITARRRQASPLSSASKQVEAEGPLFAGAKTRASASALQNVREATEAAVDRSVAARAAKRIAEMQRQRELQEYEAEL